MRAQAAALLFPQPFCMLSAFLPCSSKSGCGCRLLSKSGGLPASADLGYRSRYRTASLQASFPKVFVPEACWSSVIALSASCSFPLSICTLKTTWEDESMYDAQAGMALQGPLSLPAGNRTFLKVTAAEYNISAYHLLTLAHMVFPSKNGLPSHIIYAYSTHIYLFIYIYIE